jgi:hypothetical protein
MDALDNIRALVFALKDKALAALLRKAQRQALVEWRDRVVSPGLAARFTPAGEGFYNFGERWGAYSRRKGYLPDYVKTGRLKDMNALRQPRSVNGGGTTVITRMKFGGGNLFNLTNVGGITDFQRITERVPVTISPYSYAHHRAGTTVNVAAKVQSRKRIRFVVTRSARSMADDFTDSSRDRGWIERRTDELIGQALRDRVAVLARGRTRLAKFARGAGIGGDDGG